MRNAVGVDLGATEVRVAVVSGVDREQMAKVTRVGIAQIPEGSIVAGRIRRPEEVALALVAALRQAGAPKHGFVLGVSSPDALVFTHRLPSAVRPSERMGTIQTLARSGELTLSPTLTEDEVVMALHDGVSSEQWDDVVVTVTSADELLALRQVCLIAGLSPRAIDLSAAAAIRALVRVPGGDPNVSSIVDVGATKISVGTHRGGLLRSVRTSSGGSEDVTNALAGTGVTVKDAEALKRTLDLELANAEDTIETAYGTIVTEVDPVAVKQARAAAKVVDMQVDSIASSLEADAAKHGDVFTRGISLVGRGSRLPGFKEHLAARTGLPVRFGRPWAVLVKSKHTEELLSQGEDAVLHNLTTAVGLALWRP